MSLSDVNDSSTWLRIDFWSNIIAQTMEWAIKAIPKVLVVLILAIVLLKIVNLALGRLAGRAFSRGEHDTTAQALEHKKRVETLLGIARRVVLIAVWGMAIVLVLMQVGVDVAPVIAGAGVLGIAVGFGAQELVRDVVTGFFQLLENHIRQGDVAVINGTGGVVESIGLRTIVLRDLSGVVHVFQNGKIQTLANMTKTWSAMVFDIGVAYKSDVDQVIRIMREVGEDIQQDPALAPKILEPLEVFGVEAFEDNSVIVKARFKTSPIEQWTVGREYRRRLKYAFDQQGIEIPFPQRTLTFGELPKEFETLLGSASGKVRGA